MRLDLSLIHISPCHKGEGGAVPKAADGEHNHNIESVPPFGTAAAPKGKVDVYKRQGLVFVPNFKNTFAFLVNIVTDHGLCKSCMFLCVRSHDPQR